MVFTLSNETSYYSLGAASLIGAFPATGFESDIIPYQGYATLNIMVNSNKNTTLKIRTYHTNQKDATGANPTGRLVFEKQIDADTNYFKRFAVFGSFFNIEVVNRDATAG